MKAGTWPADLLLPGDRMDGGGVVLDCVGDGAFVILRFSQGDGTFSARVPRSLRVKVNG